MKGKLRLRIGLLLVLSVLLLLPSVPVKAFGESNRVEIAYFPANVLDVSQVAYGGYSHKGRNVTDICPHGDGSIQAPFTGTIRYIDNNWGYVVLESNNRVRYADGTIDYMSVGFMHDNDISDLHEGKVIQQGQIFYQQGKKAPANRAGEITSAHVHVVVMRGKASDHSYLYNGDVMIYNALALRQGTEIVRSGYDESLWNFGNVATPGIYTLSPACAPNSCLDVADWGSDNETNIQLWEKTGSDNQLFEPVPQTDGSYKIVSVYAKKPLDVYRGEALDEQNVQIYGDNGADAANQKWWLEEYEDGYYTITSALSDSMRLDVSAGLEENGTNIQIYTANDSEAQRWKLTFVRGLPPRISLSGQTIPGQLKVGQSFGLRGTVTASGGKLKEVYGAIVDDNRNTVQSKTYSMDSATNNLRYSVNQDLIFNKLPEGTYKYYLSAVASNSYGETREVLLNATFTVGSGSSSSSSWSSSSSSSSSGSSGSTPTSTQPPVKKETKKPTVTISGQTVPSTQKQGSNFGIRGTVSTDCGKLTWVYGYITDRNGNVLQSGEYFPNSSSDNLRYSINNDLIFDRLSAGSYIYWVKATARNGDQETTETLIYTEFQVVSDAPAATQPPETTPAPTTPTTPAAPAAPAAPNISISEQTIPGSQRVGRNFGIRGIVTTDCGQITRVYGAILDSNGNTLQSGTYYPDSSSVNLRYNINNDLIFDNLSAGNYTYYVEVTANNGGTEKTQVLINAGFTES